MFRRNAFMLFLLLSLTAAAAAQDAKVNSVLDTLTIVRNVRFTCARKESRHPVTPSRCCNVPFRSIG